MTVGVLTFDGTGTRKFETGVDHGVLYPLNPSTALYDTGVAWNGLTTVKEQPTGAGANPQFADNIKYLNLVSAEDFGGTIEAFTYPDEFAACDGTNTPFTGVTVGQQTRQTFGMSYRSQIGNDVSSSLGYKLHLVYGAQAAPSEKDFATINDSPAAVAFSWTFTCTPATVSGLAPTSLIVIDSTKVDSGALTTLLNFLYGTSGTTPSLPSPDAVIALFSGTATAVTLSPATFNGAHTITIPTQTGVSYFVDGVAHAAGTVTLTTGQSKVISARPNVGYYFNTPVVAEWLFTFVS
jgi:hypothetical protein